MERSELVAETLGEHVFEWFIRNKRAEWAAYKTHVSQFELDRYLPLLCRPPDRDRRRWNRCSASPTRSRPSWRSPLERAGYPWKAVARPEHAETRRARGRLGRGRRLRRSTTPPAPSPCAGSCAPATCPLRPLLLVVRPAPARRPRSSARTSSTTSASCRRDAEELAARLAHLFWRTGPGLQHRAHRARAARAQPRDLPGGRRGPGPRPHLHGVRAAALPRRAPGQGVHPRDAAQPGLGLRVLRRGPHRRRPRPAPAGQARRGARPPDRDGPLASATASATAPGRPDRRRRPTPLGTSSA